MEDKRCGRKLNQHRKEMGLKVDELAELSNVQPGYMRQILSGYVPSLPVLVNICRILNITLDYVFDLNGDNGDGRDDQLTARIKGLTSKEKDILLRFLDTYMEFIEEKK